jgi:DNA-binding CsgD family transcriptional regulator
MMAGRRIDWGPMSDEDADLSRTISYIYDAALDRELWPEALRATCEFCHMQCAGFGIVDVLGPQFNMISQWGYDPSVFKLYLETYVHENPLMVAAMPLPVGEVATLDQVMPMAAYRATRFYKEWAKPAGFTDTLHAWLDKRASGGASLVLVRAETHGAIAEQEIRRFRLLVPHLRKSVFIGRLLQQNRTDIQHLGETMDLLPTALFMLTSEGHLVHSNRAGHTLIRAGRGVRLRGEQLRLADASAQKRLTAALVASGAGVVVEEGQLLPISQRGEPPLVAHVLPLRHRGDPFGNPVAAVFVRKTDFDIDRAVQAMGEVYKLTAAELRVVRAVADGGGMPTVASRLGISAATARTHLAHVFQKTGAKRQAEIVRMLGGYGGPIG